MAVTLGTTPAAVGRVLPPTRMSAVVVDLLDPESWPETFRELVEATAADRGGDDELLPPALEDQARDALQASLVRAYHCTRLTQREVTSIREEGLQPLSPLLVERRLADAVEDGHLDATEAARYLRTAPALESNRRGRVWTFADRSTLADAPAVGYVLEAWGGEGINMGVHSESPEFRRLECIGTPTVMVLGLSLSQHCDRASPGVLLAAVRRLLGEAGGTTMMSVAPIEPAYIDSIEHPGGEFWSQFVWTPRAGYRYG